MLVLLALAFDFMNGFHDAANSIATVVSTGVLRPGRRCCLRRSSTSWRFHLPPERGRHGGQGHRAARRGGHPCGVRRADGRHHLERHDLVLRHSQQFLPRADRRHRGGGHRQGGLRR